MEMQQIKNRKKGFTLIELLVVISAIAVLIAVLLPSLAKAKSIGKQVACLSNMRQMSIAASTYAMTNDNYYPLARLVIIQGAVFIEQEWDFKKISNSGIFQNCSPGTLWSEETTIKIQQCPVFKGASNSAHDPYTGYNYNSSYIGGIFDQKYGFDKDSTKETKVKMPGQTVIFGDGQYSAGANKFMRSPFQGKLDDLSTPRYAGTQGFRHSGNTNAAYCDGSATTLTERYTNTYAPFIDKIADGTGFISPDNRAYDLR